MSEYSIYRSGQISNEVCQVLLDALINLQEDIRRIASIAALPHQVENISYWLKYYYLEYQSVKGVDYSNHDYTEKWEALTSPLYFEIVTEADVQELEKLIITANEEEIIGLSIAVSSIRTKNVSYLIRQLLLKVKAYELKELLLYSLCFDENYLDPDNIAFLTDLKAQKIPGKLFVAIVDTIMALRSRMRWP